MRDSQPVRIENHLSCIPLFDGLSTDGIVRIARNSREMHLRKGDYLFQRGDICSGFYVLLCGLVKLAFTSPQGGEKVVEVVQQGHSFGEALMFVDKPYIFSAQALRESQLLYISKAAIDAELQCDHDFVQKVLTVIAKHQHQLMNDVEAYSLYSGKQRIIGYLIHELQEGLCATEEAIVHLSANKSVIASRLNLSQEHFSRMLHELSNLGLIVLDGKSIRIPNVAELGKLQLE